MTDNEGQKQQHGKPESTSGQSHGLGQPPKARHASSAGTAIEKEGHGAPSRCVGRFPGVEVRTAATAPEPSTGSDAKTVGRSSGRLRPLDRTVARHREIRGQRPQPRKPTERPLGRRVRRRRRQRRRRGVGAEPHRTRSIRERGHGISERRIPKVHASHSREIHATGGERCVVAGLQTQAGSRREIDAVPCQRGRNEIRIAVQRRNPTPRHDTVFERTFARREGKRIAL